MEVPPMSIVLPDKYRSLKRKSGDPRSYVLHAEGIMSLMFERL